MRLTDEQAQAVVDAWRADARWGQVCDCMPEMYAKPTWRVRVVVAARNLQANEALWDGQFSKAKFWLMRLGIGNKNAVQTHAVHQRGFGPVVVKRKGTKDFYTT